MALPQVTRRHPPVDAEVKRLVELTEPLGRGDIMTYSDIEECVGFKRGEYQFGRVVSKWKRVVLESRGIGIGSVPTVGYRLMDCDDQLERAHRQSHVNARRCERRGTKLLVMLKDDELDDAQKSRKEAIAEHISATHEARNVSYQRLKSRIVIPRALPRPPIPEE